MNEKAMADVINRQNAEISEMKMVLVKHDKAIMEIVTFFNGLVDEAKSKGVVKDGQDTNNG